MTKISILNGSVPDVRQLKHRRPEDGHSAGRIPPLIVAITCAAALLLLWSCTTTTPISVTSRDAKSIAYTVAGQGTPVVVFQSGLGDGQAVWNAVRRDVQKRHTVFVYDRPGYGRSRAETGARDPCTIAIEARQTLTTAGLRPPYVLVGHSLGGLYQYVFAKMYPADVIGLVLLDPTHPQHWSAIQSAPASAATIKALRVTLFSATQRKEFDDQAACLDRIEMGTALSGRHICWYRRSSPRSRQMHL